MRLCSIRPERSAGQQGQGPFVREGCGHSEPGGVDVDAKQLGKLIAASISGIARLASARFHLIAGRREYVHRGQRLPDWIDEGLPPYLDQGRQSR